MYILNPVTPCHLFCKFCYFLELRQRSPTCAVTNLDHQTNLDLTVTSNTFDLWLCCVVTLTNVARCQRRPVHACGSTMLYVAVVLCN